MKYQFIFKISNCFYIDLHVEHTNIVPDCRFYVEVGCDVAFLFVVRLSFLGRNRMQKMHIKIINSASFNVPSLRMKRPLTLSVPQKVFIR
jgi:hypothetical protein